MRILSLLLFCASLASDPICIEFRWGNAGLYAHLIHIVEWIYSIKQDDSYVFFANTHNGYSHSEAIYPLLFETNVNDPQIALNPLGLQNCTPFTKVIKAPGLPVSCTSLIPVKRFLTDGMKNFEAYHAAYGTPQVFDDPDFPILRNRFHEIIQKYIVPVPSLQKRIDTLVEKMGQKEKIAIHVRCLAHYHCNKSEAEFLNDVVADIDQIMKSKDRDRTVIYLATLLDPLVKILSSKYNVISIDCLRCQDVRVDWDAIPTVDPLDRARDAIVDAWALSSCDEFWCTCSNMALFVCGINPELKTRLLPSLSTFKGF